MNSERITWAQIMDEMHKRAHKNEQEARETSQRVRQELLSQQSAFLKDFTEAEQRIFGVIK